MLTQQLNSDKNKTYLIREFCPSSDLDDAYECYVSSFYHVQWPIIDEASPQFLKDIILLYHHIGSKTFVAEVEGRVRGVLVGSFRSDLDTAGRALVAAVKMLLHMIAGRYQLSALAKKHLFQLFRGFLLYIYLHPHNSDAETLLLVSHKEYRGGIGRALMDAWIREVRSNGFQTATVGTDSVLSWDFYERYGYRRVREFDYTAYKYSLPTEKVKGYIYLMDV
jgi:ribosomal protein S18 acetylase RimI-like enzyme